jgi:hypothetical protein
MLSQFKGPKQLAILLCRFSDVPAPSLAPAGITEFVMAGGRGLFDYWRDVSYGNISLYQSIIFPADYLEGNWYTMQVASSAGASGAFRRGDLVREARRLAGVAQVDLSPFHGVIAIANGNVDSGQINADVGWGIQGTVAGQPDWRWCKKCQGMIYSGIPGSPQPCPALGNHDLTESNNYTTPTNTKQANSQPQWYWCSKCMALAYAGQGQTGACPAGNGHDFSRSAEYAVSTDPNLPRGQTQWFWCRKCQGLVYGGGVAGVCQAGGTHDTAHSSAYVMPVSPLLAVGFAAHETGHTFNLDHSFDTSGIVHSPGSDGRPGAYGDFADIMSVSGDSTNSPYPLAGPGLNAPTLQKFGWLQDGWIWTYDASMGSHPTVTLAPLTAAQGDGKLPAGMQYVMARIVNGDRIHTIEARNPVGWDQGLAAQSGGGPGVLVHELKSTYTVGQNFWRWCSNCSGLVYAETAVCPAGGVHSEDGSSDYALYTSASAGAAAAGVPIANFQTGWRWCKKCQGLAFAAGFCIAGGSHDLSGSQDYALVHDASVPGGQDQWSWCGQCQGLWFGGGGGWGTCPYGAAHRNDGFNYNLISPGGAPPSTQNKWRYCSKCLGLWYAGAGACAGGQTHDLSSSQDYSLAHDLPGAPGQAGWKYCRKCLTLAYSNGGTTGGACAALGQHDLSESYDYSIPYNPDPSNIGLDPYWWWCSKCQGLINWNGTGVAGKCPADGSQHNHTGNLYGLPQFRTDLTYLATYSGFLLLNDTYTTESGKVTVNVTALDSALGTATIRLDVSA